jgi:serine/threonine protein kinase
MDERYEIRGKIGQGGIGAVYRAFDTRMNREVAIKRILPEGDDADHQNEATQQLTKEAGALAALQHPHIVTVYDVGVDEDGPFVVMELLTGRSLEELVSSAPLTINDFREIAIQTQEALIAAQDLHIVHLDIKPGNLVLTWLPSGKFQVKIVDFGLAKFTPKPSKQTLDQNDSVFGSIFFMAPEQFERGFVDGRTDLYAMGCVYYFALTGHYPFEGDTGPRVMAAHLNHTVRPIGDWRPDLPQWLRDWVMWQLNRQPADRPSDARESLQVFLRNDGSNVNVPPPPRKQGPMRPGYVAPSPVIASVPKALEPPEGSRPSVHTTSHVLTAPPATAKMTSRVQAAAPRAIKPPPKKKKMSKQAKISISVILSIVTLLVGSYYLKETKRQEKARALQALIDAASEPAAKELPVNPEQLQSLFDALKQPKQLGQHAPTMRAIRMAKATDTTDVDVEIAKFITTADIPSDLRQMFFYDVIRRREKRGGASILIEYARTAKDASAAEAALYSLKDVLRDEDLGPLLETIESTQSQQVRQGAADMAMEVLKRSLKPGALRPQIEEAMNRTSKDDVRRVLLGLKGIAVD